MISDEQIEQILAKYDMTFTPNDDDIAALVVSARENIELKKDIDDWKSVAKANHDRMEILLAKLKSAREVIKKYASSAYWSDNRNIFYFDTASPLDMETLQSIGGNKIAGASARKWLNENKEEEDE